MAQTQQRNIRFTAEQWETIENAARERDGSLTVFRHSSAAFEKQSRIDNLLRDHR